MKRPNKAHQAINNKKSAPFPHCRSYSFPFRAFLLTSRAIVVHRGFEVVDVVLDPVLADKMRDHQKEGVKVRFPIPRSFPRSPSFCSISRTMAVN
jgi:hypothetical protein